MPIDYRELLVKYMSHVIMEEGTDFMSRYRPNYITRDEWDKLKAISNDDVQRYIKEGM